MHFNRAFMGLKNDESSEESFRGNVDSQYFINKGGVLPLLSTRVCDNIPRTASETSNLISVTSSHDSFSENAESKANLRSSYTFDASEDVEMSPKFFGGTGADDQPPLKPACVSDQGTILNKYEDTKGVEGHDDNISCISGANDAKLEAETDKGKGDLPDEALKCSDKTELVKKFNDSVELPNKSLSGDESDESDIVEHDVKVCDICGDAGREDLLAICSRCSDGAEHTYCMRDMLDKVPEGEWLCEECKFVDETEKHKQAKVEIMNGNVKNLLSGQTSTQHTDLSVKLDTRESNVEGDRTNIVSPSSQPSRKRRTDNIEADSTAKRQALETIAESPKAYNPSRTAALSRDCSFKNLDKGKVKPAHQTSHGTHSINDNLETSRIATTSPRLQPPKGALLKSNSFSSLKPKVKLEDDNVPHKQKLAREPASLDTKEGPVRMIGKSMSFKSAYAGRSTAESKVKMLSPKFSHVQDSKGLKRAKEWFTSERKTLKVDQKSMSGSNTRDLKAQSDGKFSTSSKSSGHLVCKGAEIPAPLVGASSTNGTCSSLEQKLNQISPMDETSSEMGHATQSCTIGSPRGSAIDASSARSSREEMNKDNILKAAIQAAMLKKPGVYKKNRVPDQADTSSLDLNSERAPHDQVSVSSYLRNMISAEGAHDGQAIIPGCSSDSGKQKNIIDVKQLSMHCPDPVHSFKTGELDSIVSFDGKSISSDLSSHASVAMSVLSKMPVIPEHEYAWQGDFEVYRSGKFPDLQGGIQAHLSTCSSPKVVEVVKKFPNKIPLTEVPRLSTWPTQFHNSGATENDIALYFFAKDFESYERNYKVLLESMVKNDLALKGNLDGVELLIFPSNRLPEKSQRWNMLSFVWGVFRAQRVSCLDHIPSSSDKFGIPGSNVVMAEKDIPSAIMSLPENLCSSRRINEESSEHDRPCDSNASASLKSPILSPPAKINGDYDPKPSSSEHRFSCLQAKSEQHYSRRDYQSSSRISTSIVQLCPESRWTTTSLRGNDEPECKPDMEKGNSEPECKPDLEPQPHVEARGTNSGSNKCEKMAIHLDFSNNEGSTSSSSKIFSVGPEEAEDKLNRERPILGIIQTTSQASSSGRSDTMPWNNSLGDENVGKKQKTGFSEIFGLENTRKDKMDVVDDSETSERYFFPVESPLGFGGDINSMPWKNKEVRIHDEVPNLELALGKQGILAPPPRQGILPFFIGAAGREKKNNEKEKSPDKIITEDEEESASLSLSLSFPFPDEERSVKPSSKVNTSLILFGDFSDK